MLREVEVKLSPRATSGHMAKAVALLKKGLACGSYPCTLMTHRKHTQGHKEHFLFLRTATLSSAAELRLDDLSLAMNHG